MKPLALISKWDRIKTDPFIFTVAVCLTAFVFSCVLAIFTDRSYASWMRRACVCPVSIVDLLLVKLIPLLVCSVAAFFSKPRLLYGCLFVRCLLFCYSALLVALAFGKASWLILPLVLFSECILIPVQIWFVSGHAKGTFIHFWRDTVMGLAFTISAVTADYLFISPFLAGIFH